MSRKRTAKDRQDLLKNFAQGVTRQQGAKYLFNSQGEISMSDAIWKLIEPYTHDAPTYGAFRTLVTFACTACNASILPADEQSDLIDKMLAVRSSKNEENRLDMFAFITALMERKKRLFPDISRLIVEFKVTDTGDGFHIAVASTMKERSAQNAGS
jgi:hypothetical protein